MYRILFMLFLIFTISSCNYDEPQLFDPTYFGESIKGITFVDETGEILKEDPSDWCIGTNHLVSNYSFGPAYPNPVTKGKSFTIRFSLPKSTFLEIYIINTKFQITNTIVNSQLAAGIYSLNINTDEMVPNIYRLMFKSEGFSCSGDVWIKGK